MGRNFWKSFNHGFQAADAVIGEYERSRYRAGMERAADVKPETVEEVGDYTKTMGLTGADEQARMLAEQDAYFGADGARSTADALNSNAADTTPASGMVKTSYRMGGQTQDTPFRQEQIDAHILRNQAGVHQKFGNAREATVLQGLAKSKDDEDVTNQIRIGGQAGMKNTKDMRDEEKMFAASKGMYETALRMNRPDLASTYYQQMMQNRDVLLSRANDRAERVYRATGSIGGYVDNYNRYLADGMTIDSFKRNDDGSHTFTINDGGGQSREVVVPKDKTGDYLLALRDPKRVADIEQKRAEILFKAQTDAQEKLNAPVAVGKDQTLVIPATGQTFAPGAGRGFDVKEAGPVLDDARRILLERSGNFDQGTGKWNWSQEAQAKAVVAERLFMKNPGLTPAMLAEIADKGTTGTAVVDVGGKQQRVPAVSFGGRTYLLGGDSGVPEPAAAPAPASVKATGLGTRDVRGKVGGMQRVDAFPKVSSADQAARDIDAGRLLVAEAGGIEQARRELQTLDAELANQRLDGTQRGILQSHRNRLAAGIAASS